MEPEITGFEFYIDAFHELSTARQFGMGVGPIPFTAIAEYFTIYNIEGDFFEFSGIIRQMDNVYLELNAADMKNPEQDKGSVSSGAATVKKNDNN